MFKRYAVFHTPPSGDFADFCASWLGWDSRAGQRVSHPRVNGFDIAAVTDAPRKYGFHGTLKAPFRLTTSQSVDHLKAAFAVLAKKAKPVRLDAMALRYQHGFLALRPVGTATALNELAARLVTDLDQFRAPATPKELAHRRQVALTERQDRNLIRWGYPFVMEDFHFHLTLSDSLDEATAQKVRDQLHPALTPLVPRPFMIDHIALMGQTMDGMFHEIQRHPLTG